MTQRCCRLSSRKIFVIGYVLIYVLPCVLPSAYVKNKAEPKPAPYNRKGSKKPEANVKDHLNFKFVPDIFEPWLKRNCFPLRKLLNRKAYAVGKIQSSVVTIENDESLTTVEKQYHVQTFRIFIKELNETESGIIESLNWLNMVLTGDFKHLDNLQEKSLARLNYLKDAVLVEEQEYQDIVIAQVREELLFLISRTNYSLFKSFHCKDELFLSCGLTSVST